MDSSLDKLKAKVSDSSYKQYSRIYKLLALANIKDLEDVQLIKAKIEDKSPNTQKNYYAAIVALLRQSDDKVLLDTYISLMNSKIEETKPTNKYNEKQKAALLSMKEIESIRDSLLTGITNFKNRLGYNLLLDHMILSLYTMQPPRRNEFFNMRITHDMAKIDEEHNWLVWSPKRKFFVYQDYKTAKTYGQEMQAISKKLESVIRQYLEARDNIALPGNDHFLVKYGNLNFENSNDITRRLNKVLGKKIGASMIRHIYLSEKYGKTLKSMEDDAVAMGHSTSQQREYIKD